MSHFLRNLIARHKVGDVNQKASYIVQPRPKSRFELDSGAGLEITQHDPEMEPVTPAASKQASRNPLGANQNESVQEPNDQNELAPITEQSNSQNLSMADELSTRTQTILRRLDGQQPQRSSWQPKLNSRKPQRADNQSSAETWQYAALSNTANNALTGSEEVTLILEPSVDFAQNGRVKKQSIENRSEHRESHQSGLLQIPGWLTELQSDLNNRWREVNSQAEPEPVVNVTIGRVEVRAVQTDSAKKPKTRNKPSGIMSLDDYLQRRNRELK